MSVQKIIAEADKLLEKGKTAEAVEKLKAALQAEPMNQLATTKLANAYADAGSKDKAAATFVSLANRLSDAGKSQVAIAVYKQALELTPNDIALKFRYAQECESVGKVGDAQNQAQGILQHYLRRKKFFDATNILPMLVRLNGKDERLKQVWLEVMQYSQAEKKLAHLLVALCGPPGLVSDEFKVGGEPAALSEPMYEGLKRLVAFFPRDPKVAYAAAWCAYRRGRFKDFFRCLRECLRREPDFCLAILLFARVLAEREKVNESYFVFKFLKERLAADKSVDDIATLNQLVEAFVEKNGWVALAEQRGDHWETPDFLRAIRGADAEPGSPPSGTEPSGPAEPAPLEVSASVPLPAAPSISLEPPENAEAELPPAEIELGSGGDELEIQHHTETRLGVSVTEPGPAAASAPETPEATTVLPAPPEPAVVAAPRDAPEIAEEEAAAAPPEPAPGPPPEAAPKAGGFNPLLEAAIDASGPAPDFREAPTQIFSPMELIEVAKAPGGAFADVKTQAVPAPGPPPAEAAPGSPPPAEPTASTLPSHTEGIPAPAGAWSELKVDGAVTELYSPMDTLQAQNDSRPHQAIPGAPGENDPTRIVDRNAPDAAEAPLGASVDGGGVIPIPAAAEAGPAAPPGPTVDLGDDLLDGATRILIAPPGPDSTQNLIQELRQEIAAKEDGKPEPTLLLRKAERFIAKRNYYLARKALRHALALGADEATVKNRLRDIRKLELPESLYHAVSSDRDERRRSGEILERLEAEFDVAEDADADREVSASIEQKLEDIFRDHDPRTILDFGVGLHEMGLYRQAERVFARIVSEFPELSFDAYYLAAVSKFSRKDYAGAASILKKLSLDADRTELEKIQIYYALGELFEKMSQRDRSQEFFRKVAELDSNYRNIRHKLES